MSKPDRPVVLDGSYVHELEIEFPNHVSVTMMEDPSPREVGEDINILRVDCLGCDTLRVRLDIGTKPFRLVSHSTGRAIDPFVGSSPPAPGGRDQVEAFPVEFAFNYGLVRTSTAEARCAIVDKSLMSEIAERE